MSAPPSRRFPGVNAFLQRKPVVATPPPPPKASKNKGGRAKKAKPLHVARVEVPTTVYASILEGRSALKGRIGVAAINPATTEFYLFNFADSAPYASLKALLRALAPTDVLLHSAVSIDQQEAVLPVCPRADVVLVKKTYYDGGKETYARLINSKPQDLTGKELSLSAFAALVKYAEHQSGRPFLPSSSTIHLIDPNLITCPLCENDESAETCKMGSIKTMQEHFFHHHWQVHGYACHCCGVMYPTAEVLMSEHSECDEWARWREEKRGGKDGKIAMTVCRMMLCCSDCGWHTTLSGKETQIMEEGKMNYLKTFFAHHNNDALLGMLVYFPEMPSEDVEAIRFPVHSIVGGDPTAPCVHCLNASHFKDPAEANEHYMQYHRNKALTCDIDGCGSKVTTEYILEQHQLSHVHDNSFFADYLSNTARILPPPADLCSAPRCGWKDRAKTEDFAFGGVTGGSGTSKGFDLVGLQEDVREAKARLIKKRRRFDKDKGYENAVVQQESAMARQVREELKKKFGDCSGIMGFDDTTWLRDEDAVKFREWMEYWESEEGKKLGGPPKEIIVDVSDSVVRIPSVEVELQFGDMDVISGFLLNDKIFYCGECDSILKGKQAFDHLKKGKQATKCAKFSDAPEETNPIMNKNMFQLYSPAVSSPESSLPCPHCEKRSCSITGLRVHIMCAHGIYVKCQRMEREWVTDVAALKMDIRMNTEQRKRGRPSGEREEAEEEEVALIGDVPIGRSMKRREEDDRAVRYAVQKMVAFVARKEDRARAGEAKKMKVEKVKEKKKPEPVPVDDGNDSDVVMIEDDVVDEGRKHPSVDDISMEEENDRETEAERKKTEEDEKEDSEGTIVQPVIRHFTPDGDDDDLCLVAEVESTGFTAFAAAIAKQREKKFHCPQCSCKFMTKARMDDHLRSHEFDAGRSTLMEELGIPLSTRLYICKGCCLAFATLEMKTAHAQQHGTTLYSCETCSGFAYNPDVLNEHLKRLDECKVSYICGDCKLDFQHEPNLYQHCHEVHGVPLFYFCKTCEIGSTNGVEMYYHYMREECAVGVRDKGTHAEATKHIGLIPANQLHFQPVSLDVHKVVFEMHPENYVVPSLCTHRSMLVATEARIVCKDCRGLESYATHAANHERITGRKWNFILNSGKNKPPLARIRARYEAFLKERAGSRPKAMAPANNATAGRAAPTRGATVAPGALPASVLRAQAAAARSPRLPLYKPLGVQHRMDPRLNPANQLGNQAMTMGGGAASSPLLVRPLSGSPFGAGGGGSMLRGSAQSPLGGLIGAGGGPTMRGSLMLAHSPLGGQSGAGGGMIRGPAAAPVRPNGDASRMMNWARARGYSASRDLQGMPDLSAAETDDSDDGPGPSR